MWPKCAFGEQKCLIRQKAMPFGSPPHRGIKNCGLLEVSILFLFLPFMGSKSGILGQKTVFWDVLDRV